MSESDLRQRSGLGRSDVRALLDYLNAEELLDHREAQDAPLPSLLSRFSSPLQAWVRRLV